MKNEDFSQLKSIVAQCDSTEKLELFHLLEQETFTIRFKNLLNAIKTDAISLDDITAEVELVRQKQYYAQ